MKYGTTPATLLGIEATADPWLAYQWNEAIDLWGTAVDDRLDQRRMEPFEPPKQHLRPVPVHDVNSALGLDDEGNPIDPLFAQQDELMRRFGAGG